jgi:hypothetical protein
MLKIWGKTLKRNKIKDSHMVEYDMELTHEAVFNGLYEICKKFDLSSPIVLEKHKKDMDNFLLMRFSPQDFIEEVDFDRLEIEIYLEKKNN